MVKNQIKVKPLEDLENILGYRFKKQDLLRQAVTHASAISEKHPLAHEYDQSSLAFVGDSVLKYAVARYLFLNGCQEVAGNRHELHKGTQTVIPNKILANIAREKLHLEEYIIRGNGHKDLSDEMYASCLEAILGAIALDCEVEQQAPIFRVIEKLCSDRYKHLLNSIDSERVLSGSSAHGKDVEELICDIQSLWNDCQHQAGAVRQPVILMKCPKTGLEKFGLMVLWFFALCGIFFVIREIVCLNIFSPLFISAAQRNEF